MIIYNPNEAPNPEAWLALDEQLRIQHVEDYHLNENTGEPNSKSHAAIHAIIENQIALNLDSVVNAMLRLTGEGLERHEAIHAIGSVLAEQVFNLSVGKHEKFSQAAYDLALDELTVKKWLES